MYTARILKLLDVSVIRNRSTGSLLESTVAYISYPLASLKAASSRQAQGLLSALVVGPMGMKVATLCNLRCNLRYP